jgi:hypothetical protein
VLSGAHAEYDIDELNRIRGQANYFANGHMGSFDYGFDAMGRRRYEQRDGGTADGYQYDPSDEVTGYQRDGTLNGDGTVSGNWWLLYVQAFIFHCFCRYCLFSAAITFLLAGLVVASPTRRDS